MKTFFKKTVVAMQFAVLATGTMVASSSYADNTSTGANIAFVNTERILRDSAPAKAAQARLEKEFAARDKKIQDMATQLKSMSAQLDKDAPALSDSDRSKRQRALTDLDRQYQVAQQSFREDLNQRRNEELSGVLDNANKVIKQIADSNKYDIIFQEAVYVSPRIDITDKVIQALSK